MTIVETIWVLIGLASIAPALWMHRDSYRAGVGMSGAEAAYYAIGLAALVVGWYFNFQYFRTYGDEANWWHWTQLLFANPASSSGGQDLVFANVLLFPMWTVIESRRQGLRIPWIWFFMSLVTSFAFAMALYLGVEDRQRRAKAAGARPVPA